MALLDAQQAQRLDAVGLDPELGAGRQDRLPDGQRVAGRSRHLVGEFAREADAEQPHRAAGQGRLGDAHEG
jgi:hypothetical protein